MAEAIVTYTKKEYERSSGIAFTGGVAFGAVILGGLTAAFLTKKTPQIIGLSMIVTGAVLIVGLYFTEDPVKEINKKLLLITLISLAFKTNHFAVDLIPGTFQILFVVSLIFTII